MRAAPTSARAKEVGKGEGRERTTSDTAPRDSVDGERFVRGVFRAVRAGRGDVAGRLAGDVIDCLKDRPAGDPLQGGILRMVG